MSEISIRAYREALEVKIATRDTVDRIFFEASSVQSFKCDAAREAFRWLWLGRYLVEEPEHAFVAVNAAGDVCGYLVGSLRDPAPRPEFNQLAYFADFAGLTIHYPAHLHINVANGLRSQGVGARLIEAFAQHAAAAGAPGMHIVTGAGMRNVGFYLRNGFDEVGRAPYKNGTVVMLGRKLVPAAMR